MNKLFDLNDPFFRPLWLRIAIVVFSLGWGVFEFSAGAPSWGVLFCGIGAYAFYGLFIAFDPRDPKSDEEGTGPGDG